MKIEEIIDFYAENANQTFLTTRELLKAQEILNNFFDDLNKIKMLNSNLSELQVFLYAYEFACNRPYCKSIVNNDPVHVLVNGEATIEGYCLLMKLICQKLKIPFLYNTVYRQDMENDIVDKCSNFQVIVADKNGIKHCLHCDPYLDSPKIDDKTFKYNATLISLSDLEKKGILAIPLDKVTQLFFDLTIRDLPFSERANRLDFINSYSKKIGVSTLDRYKEFNSSLSKIGEFLGINIGELDKKEDFEEAYRIIKNKLNELNIPICEEELYEEAKEVKQLELKLKYNLSFGELERYSEKIIDSRIENRNNYLKQDKKLLKSFYK